jgi:hypothetical protein
MGAQYGLLSGVVSKMTLTNKEGSQLPTFGNVGLMYRYQAFLQTLRDHATDNTAINNNLFIFNPNLFVNVSSKNQIATKE